MKSKSNKDAKASQLRADTRLVVGGRDPSAYHGFVNPPVYHASTVLYPSADDLIAHRARYQYGRRGTPTSEAPEDAVRAIEGPGCPGRAPFLPGWPPFRPPPPRRPGAGTLPLSPIAPFARPPPSATAGSPGPASRPPITIP